MIRIAFIGAGNMGLPMLRNLLAAGHEVRAYDVSPDALAEAVRAGAGEAVSLADAVTAAEVVITMLPEGRHVRAVYLDDGGNDGIVGHAPREALLADCSTIDVASARAGGGGGIRGWLRDDRRPGVGRGHRSLGGHPHVHGGRLRGRLPSAPSRSSPRWGATSPTSADRDTGRPRRSATT